MYKVSFKSCPVEYRKNFYNSSCLMPISVGQKIHEGEKFGATVKLVNDSFKSCTVLLDDSIQRHTFKISDNDSDTNLYKKALKEGDLWLERNKKVFKQFTISYKILRWDDWTQHPNFSKWHNIVKELYKKNKIYELEKNFTIEEFLSRYVRRFNKNEFSYEKAFECCLAYLQEECAVMCLWAEEEYDYEVYPTGRNNAMIATHQLLINQIYPSKLRSVSLHFRKYVNAR